MGALLNRRRYMGGVSEQYDENSYVQDGLVFQLDGINKGGISGAWTDLKGGISLSNADTSAYEMGANYVKILSGSMDSNSYVAADENFTVEISMNTGSYGLCFWCGARGKGQPNIRTSNRTLIWTHFLPFFEQGVTAYTPHTLSFNNTNGMVDGVVIQHGTRTQNYSTAAQTAIVGNNNIFYAIRIYNRQLTTEEMGLNQKIDNTRFHLGLNI